jgi:hypothetical protein
LIILVPFTSINFSTVKAQEYGAYDNDMFSKYPTEENKYECRTGPLEGFFVSSVEFCKHIKFDSKDDRKDIRDNRTGIQGPPGPQGPPGITFINSTNTYTRSANSTGISPFPGVFITAARPSCDSEDFAINGGFSVQNIRLNAVTVQDIRAGSNGWQITLESPIAFQPFITTVTCFNNPPP